MTAAGFERLGIRPPVLDALTKMGYMEPTPVQAAAIPVLLSGRDALVEAETGSGKTAAYGVPAVAVGSAQRGLRVLVLVPTRELARQVADEVRAIATGSPFRGVALTGGLSEEQEERALFGDTRCAVATPGRLLALLESGKVRLDKVDLVVLDEADRMLDMGFRADVEKILHAASNRKQTALFSATLPPGVIRLADAHLRDPADVRVGGGEHIPKSLEHHRINVRSGQKEAALVALLKNENPERAMVFVRTRGRATEFTKLLKRAGLAADQLQGNMTHEQRRHVFDLFTRGVTRILVATDLASRGLDVPEMELVVQVDLPDEDETYLHRAGRAARMGREGRVITFVLPDEKPRRVRLEEVAGLEFAPYRLEFSAADLPPEAPPQAPKAPPKKRAPKPAPPPTPKLTRAEREDEAAEAEAEAPRKRPRTPRAPTGKAPSKKGAGPTGPGRGGAKRPPPTTYTRDGRPRPPPGGRWKDMPKEGGPTRKRGKGPSTTKGGSGKSRGGRKGPGGPKRGR